LSILYAVAVYVFFAVTFCYAIGFVGNVFVPKSIDSGEPASLAGALVVNLALLAVFAIQHSVMARRGFKQAWTRFVPQRVERSTYVLFATAALALLLWQWRPIPQPIVWQVTDPLAVNALWAVFWLGWGVLLLATFLINHFELFGLQQAFTRTTSVRQPQFRTPLLYRYVRHPIYLGFMLAFWAAPVMSAGHLLFAAGATGYILIGIAFEERDLIAQFGEEYRRYRTQVGMLIPSRRP
jgi:protein-S-isoprenylcysteine O-methyltransferase Ste14